MTATARGPIPTAIMPVREVPAPAPSLWSALPYILVYWAAAIGVILMNADILHKMRCPAMLTAWHQFCCTVLVNLLWVVAPRLFDPSSPRLSVSQVVRRVLPIAFLFALTLGVGNRAYMYLSVAFIQMVKASHPVLTYVLSCLIGVEAFFSNKLQATMLVTVGVILSVTGELQFNFLGFGIQMFGSLAECLRVVLIGILLSKNGLKLDPLSTLSYVAPLAFLVLLPMAVITEKPEDFSVWLEQLRQQVGFGVMLLNGLLAFFLNIAVVSLISRTDPVVYVVVGVLKDILTVIISGFLFTAPVTRMQVAGYLLALAGVQVYNMVQKHPGHFERGLHLGLWALACGGPPPRAPESSKGLLPGELPTGGPYRSVDEEAQCLALAAEKPGLAEKAAVAKVAGHGSRDGLAGADGSTAASASGAPSSAGSATDTDVEAAVEAMESESLQDGCRVKAS